MRMQFRQPEENGPAIAVYFAVCICVCGLFVFGFCKMFEPRHIPNLGVAAFKPYPATIVQYAASTNMVRYAPETPDETSGRATHVAESPSAFVPLPDPVRVEEAAHPMAARTARARRAEIKPHETRSHRAERSGWSSATGASRNLAAAFPGYAALH
jgi:hypothetical protein